MHLGALTKPELIFVGLSGSDRPTILRALAERLAGESILEDPDELYRRLWEREELGSTGIGSGVAIPHCKTSNLEEVVVAIGTSRRGVDYDSEDGLPVHLLFLVVSPDDKPADHLRSLSAISKWVKNKLQMEKILEIDDPEEIYQLLEEEEV